MLSDHDLNLKENNSKGRKVRWAIGEKYLSKCKCYLIPEDKNCEELKEMHKEKALFTVPFSSFEEDFKDQMWPKKCFGEDTRGLHRTKNII